MTSYVINRQCEKCFSSWGTVGYSMHTQQHLFSVLQSYPTSQQSLQNSIKFNEVQQSSMKFDEVLKSSMLDVLNLLHVLELYKTC